MLKRIKKCYHQCNIWRHRSFSQIKGFIFSLNRKRNEQKEPIDFVVSWVDGADPQWKAAKDHYARLANANNETNGECRYRDWDIFRYWFRAVEKYAPWVRRVYLVTYGHIPDWLERNHPKLRVIRHDEYMDASYLPTFSSIPIELNLHKIDGLSEHFVYFNDDMILGKPVTPETFFQGGIPVHCAIAKPLHNRADNSSFVHHLLGVAGLINDNYIPETYMLKNPEKWFCACYGKDRKFNARAVDDGYAPGFLFSHLACPLRKSTMEVVWRTYFQQLDATCRNKFRTHGDIMHQIFSVWEMVNGTFVPTSKESLGYVFGDLNHTDKIKAAFLSYKYSTICLNDGEYNNNFVEAKEALRNVLEVVFSEKSTFEK